MVIDILEMHHRRTAQQVGKKPLTLQFALESSIHDLNDRDVHNLSLNSDDSKLRVFFLATAMEFPFALHSIASTPSITS